MTRVHWLDAIFPSTSASRTCEQNARGTDPPVNPISNSLKGLILVSLCVATFLACWAAAWFKAPWARLKVLPLLSMVGGGVFLATCLLDLLPDAIESWEKAEASFDFPLAPACAGVGFTFILTIEQIALFLQETGRFGNSHIPLHDDPASDASSVSHSHEEGSELDPTAALSAYLMVTAISLHALFEGVSIAVIDDSAKLVEIFFALLIHKTIIGFTLGLRLWQSGIKSCSVVVCAAILSSMVMIGGFAGISILHLISGGSKSTAAIVTCVLQGLSCGTFIYITTIEIIPHELHKRGARILKVLAFILGCSVVVVFTIVFPDA